MKCTILMGSPRKQGNTAAVIQVVTKELLSLGCECRRFDLYQEQLSPCLGCKACQDEQGFGCVREDRLNTIYESVQDTDLLILASPIYCWFCTAPMKAAMDRLIYATNKFYGKFGKKTSLLKGKAVAAVATCGYRPEKGSDLWDEALRRWCKHGAMEYRGMLSLRDFGGSAPFMTEEYIAQAKAFAREQHRMAAEHMGESYETY